MSEWTRKLSKQQMEAILKDTREWEAEHPDQPQQHVHADIKAELEKRNERTN